MPGFPVDGHNLELSLSEVHQCNGENKSGIKQKRK